MENEVVADSGVAAGAGCAWSAAGSQPSRCGAEPGAAGSVIWLQAVFDEADLLGCSRVEWTTDKDNTGAQAFYEDLGLSSLPSRRRSSTG